MPQVIARFTPARAPPRLLSTPLGRRLAADVIEAVAMFEFDKPLVWMVGAVVLVGAIVALRRHFGAEARARRRRERSHGRVISRRHGPAVKLAVETEKPKKNR